MNIVIPMAGKGQRFRDAGYTMPKPFIPVNGVPIIRAVVNNIYPSGIDSRLVLICLPEHEEEVRKEFPSAIVVTVPEVTKGAACTVLHAREYIDNKEGLVVASCDQLIDWDAHNFYFKTEGLDGALVTYKSSQKHHSFCKLTGEYVTEVAEKKVISDNANIGVYYFGSGEDFVTAAERMIFEDDNYNGEYYIAPIYNHLIKMGKSKIKIYDVKPEKCHILGTPVELRKYLKR